MESFDLGSKTCYIYKNGKADTCLLQPVGSYDLTILDREVALIKELAPSVPFTFAAMLIDDWNNELSPWEAPAVFGNENFGAGANDTLSFITEALLKKLNMNTDHIYLGGYSLAGLFSLWAAYQTDIFSGIAAVALGLVSRMGRIYGITEYKNAGGVSEPWRQRRKDEK